MKEIGKKELDQYINCEYFKSKYIFLRFIGKGGFGFVVEGKLKVDDRESFAIKIVKKWEGYESYIANEINIHSKLDHENIVDLRGFRRSEKAIFIEMELMKGGHLGSFIAQRRREGRPVQEHEAILILKQVLKAVAHLHENNIIHRDIKPENILLASFEDLSTVKISDFGLSLQFDPNISTGFENRCGTEMFKSPEQLVQRTYHKVWLVNNEEPVDIWGLGVVGYMLMNEGKHPFADGPVSPEDLLKNIKERELTFGREDMTDFAKDLISRLLKKDYLERYTAKEALNHPWFSKEGKGLIPLRLFETYRMYDAKFAIRKVFYLFIHEALTALVILNACKSSAKNEQDYGFRTEAPLADSNGDRSVVLDPKSFLTTVGVCILNKSSSQKKRIIKRDGSFEPMPSAHSKAEPQELHSVSALNTIQTVAQPMRPKVKNTLLNIASKSLRRKVIPSKVLADLDQLLYQRGNRHRNSEAEGTQATYKAKLGRFSTKEWAQRRNGNAESQAHSSAPLADSQLSLCKGNLGSLSKLDKLDANYFEKVRLYKYHFQSRYDKENFGGRKNLLSTAEDNATGKRLTFGRNNDEFGDIRQKLQDTHKTAKQSSGDHSGCGSILLPLNSKENLHLKLRTEQELANKTSSSIPRWSRNGSQKTAFVIRASNRGVLG